MTPRKRKARTPRKKIAMRFKDGVCIGYLADCYGLTIFQVEEIIRDYMNKKGKK